MSGSVTRWEEMNNKELLMPEEFICIFQQIVDYDAQDMASITVTNKAYFSDIEQSNKYIFGSKYDPGTISGSAPWNWPIRRYATGELNFNTFSLPIPPDESIASVGDYRPKIGFVENDLFPSGEEVSLTLSFGDSVKFSIPGITIQWCLGTGTDETTPEYATSFQVDILSNGTVSKSISVNDNTSASSLIDIELETCSGIKITVLEWCVSHRRARIEQVEIGQTLIFEKNSILSYSHESSRDPISAQLSKDSISYTLDNADQKWNPLNPKGAYRYLYAQQPVIVYYGIAGSVDSSKPAEWILGGKFYLSEWNVPSNSISASFSARDFFSFLMESEYTGRKYGTLYEMVNDAIELYRDRFPSESNVIDERLKNYSSDITKSNTTYKNSDIIQMAANAAGMYAYQNRNGSLHIGYVEELHQKDFEIAQLNNYDWPEISFSKPLKCTSCTIEKIIHTYPESPTGNGATQTISNPLVTEPILSQSKNVLTQAYSVLSNRRKVSLNYRAVPCLDALDSVMIHHQFGYSAKVLLTNTKYTFSGGFKGQLEGYIVVDVSSLNLSTSNIVLDFLNPTVIISASVAPSVENAPVISWSVSPADGVSLHVLTNEDGRSTCSVEWAKPGVATVMASIGNVSSFCTVRSDYVAVSFVPEGSILNLKENGSYASFVLAKHNYYPDYNTNRSLFVRQTPYVKKRFNDVGDNPKKGYYEGVDGNMHEYYYWRNYNYYDNSEIEKWLTEDYLKLFSKTSQSNIVSTVFGVRSSRSVFLLTADELGINTGAYKTGSPGTILPTAKQLLEYTDYCWTRSYLHDASYDGLSGDDKSRAEHERVCCSLNGIGRSVKANRTDVWVRPAFTLPGTLKVDGHGNIVEE